jgi:hypothetical protein
MASTENVLVAIQALLRNIKPEMQVTAASRNEQINEKHLLKQKY